MTTLIQFFADELQIVCLAAGLLLSLVLPLMASGSGQTNITSRQPWMRTVWTGQIFAALGGLWIIVLPRYSLIGLTAVIIVCVLFARKLRRQTHAVVHAR